MGGSPVALRAKLVRFSAWVEGGVSLFLFLCPASEAGTRRIIGTAPSQKSDEAATNLVGDKLLGVDAPHIGFVGLPRLLRRWLIPLLLLIEASIALALGRSAIIGVAERVEVVLVGHVRAPSMGGRPWLRSAARISPAPNTTCIKVAQKVDDFLVLN